MSWKKHIWTYGPGLAWLAGGFGVSLTYMYPHTLGLSRYKQVLSPDKSVNIKAELLLAEEIKQHFGWQRNLLHNDSDFEIVQGKQLLDISHIGSTQTRWGAVLTLPALFTESSLQFAKDNPVDFFQKYNFVLDKIEGLKILDLFKLSSEAKKFALAREMTHANSFQVYVHFFGILATYFSSIVMTYALSYVISIPGIMVISFLTIAPALGYVVLKALDSYDCSVQAKSDAKAASINPEVANGGIEYYTTLLACSKALENVQKHVSSTNEKESIFEMAWRKKTLSLDERRTHLLKVLKKLYG